MSNHKQEHISDIIDELDLADTGPFDFAYLVGHPDKIEAIDVIKSGKRKRFQQRFINIKRVTIPELAERLRSALERDTKCRPVVVNNNKIIYGALADIVKRCERAQGDSVSLQAVVLDIYEMALKALRESEKPHSLSLAFCSSVGIMSESMSSRQIDPY